MLNFYSFFLPNVSAKLAPLYRLLQKDVKWRLEKEERKCFDQSKTMLTSAKLLAQYDPKKQLVISYDVSAYSVGAVPAHELEDNPEHPIAYAARSLNSIERNYTQIDREGLTVTFAVTKLHTYNSGRKVVIYKDHRSLLRLFREGKPIPCLVSSRIQRWALTLAAHSYKLCHRAGKQNVHIDVLSRLPLPVQIETVDA
ncbi:polyprotein [Plakobranchus ocellatus]|uniref:Polyprotein n=1 Tax=Plakobranchus ocellatus TaxID=259542 RepID=A0AAV4B0S4_9GAST|nr:polyprotein [Plakobranchus ocellatus]